ncbi:type II secretion system protein GspL [Oceanospirillum sp.]|uniref:type II secretion system protein GspL n=1 Tax=Oceanospirillum sp. TaxID=2021254 RepID=UPI003A8EC80B
MPCNLVVIYQPYRDPENPLVWFPLDQLELSGNGDEPAQSAMQGNFSDFHETLAAESPAANLYLFLADELLSFHRVDVPQGVKRSLQKLLPVLLEEQLAQDIEQIGVHYVDAQYDDSVSETIMCNTAVWDRQSLEALMTRLKAPGQPDKENNNAPTIRLKACLPCSVCPLLDEAIRAQPRPDFWQIIPRLPPAYQLQITGRTDNVALQLETHQWNLITPEHSEVNPMLGVFAVGMLAAGLYLLNQWLSVF